MKRARPLLLSLMLLILASRTPAAAQQAGEQTPQEFTAKTADGETAIRYWLFLPSQLAERDRWPLMLFLHGAGERGEDLEKVKMWGPPKLVGETKDFPFILVSPQCPAEKSWDPDALAALVDQVAQQHPVDRSRMYVTGLSMGGYGSWRILAQYPQLFAAGIPICGGGDPKQADNLKDIPIWAFHGDQDRAVPVERSQEMLTAIQAAGGTKAKLTIYPGVGHNSWSQTYDNPDIYQWLLEHRRAK
jgi:predicted peptidase